MIFPGIFGLVVGLGILGQWLSSYLRDQIPELETEPIRIWFHIAGEALTALALITSGIGLLTGVSWAPALYFLAVGMLIYTSVVSPGYFAQQGKWGWMIFFGLLLALATLSLFYVLRALPI